MTIVGLGVAFAAGPVLDGVAGASQWFGGRSVAIVGISAASLGLALSVWSQFAMGSSWRIGVDPAERTALVTGGPFRYVRNPIYTGTVLFMIGLFLLVPNAASLIALVVVAVMLDLQVRRIEEPFLAESHGYEYRRYIAEAGRFIPRVSRFPPRRANR